MMCIDGVIRVRMRYICVAHKEKDNCLQTWLKSLEGREQVEDLNFLEETGYDSGRGTPKRLR
jgi:hypothetical protein